MADLVILAHADSWDGRFQITSLAASAAAGGGSVEVALFFAALASWVREEWDRHDPRPPVTAERIASLNMPPLTEMLAPGRTAGRIRLYACSASARLAGLDPARVQERVDAVLGWQSFTRMITGAGQVVTLGAALGSKSMRRALRRGVPPRRAGRSVPLRGRDLARRRPLSPAHPRPSTRRSATRE